MKTLNNFGLRKQDDTLKEQVIHEFLQPCFFSFFFFLVFTPCKVEQPLRGMEL